MAGENPTNPTMPLGDVPGVTDTLTGGGTPPTAPPQPSSLGGGGGAPPAVIPERMPLNTRGNAPAAPGPQAPPPAAADLAHHSMLGRAFRALMGNPVEYQSDASGKTVAVPVPQKPGQIFRGMIAAAIMGGAMGAKAPGGGFGGGFAAGEEGVRQDRQQKDQQAYERARQGAADQRAAQQAKDEHDLHMATIAHTNMGISVLQHQLHNMEQEDYDKKVASSKAYEEMMKNTDGAKPVTFSVGGQSIDSMTAPQFRDAFVKDPNLLHAQSPDYVRHFVDVNDGTELHRTADGNWTDDSGKPVRLSDSTTIRAYDIPTQTFKTPQMVPGSRIIALNPDLKGAIDPNKSYSLTPEGMASLKTTFDKAQSERALTNQRNADAEKARAEADKARQQAKQGLSTNDVMEKYGIQQGETGDQVLKRLPGGLAENIGKLARYDVSDKMFSTWVRNNAQGMTRQEATTLASLVNPKYREGMYDTIQQNRKNYTDSKREGGQIEAFNKFLGHAKEAADVTAHWRTTNIPLLNTPLNKLRDQVKGDPKFTQFEAALAPVRKEYMNFLNQNRAEHENDIKVMDTVLSDTATPAQIEAALKQLAGTAVTQLRSLDENFKTVAGYGVPNIVNPNTRRALQRLSDKDRNLADETSDMDTGGTWESAGQNVGKPSNTANQKPLTSVGTNQQTGQTIGWDGTQWVDANTRQPVQLPK